MKTEHKIITVIAVLGSALILFIIATYNFYDEAGNNRKLSEKLLQKNDSLMVANQRISSENSGLRKIIETLSTEVNSLTDKLGNTNMPASQNTGKPNKKK